MAGLAAFYHHRTVGLPLGVRGGLVEPVSHAQSAGTTKRLVWDDNGWSQWQNLSLRSGSVQLARFDKTTVLPATVSARGHFGPDGFQGRLTPGPLDRIADAVVAVPPAPALAVSMDDDGNFLSGVDQVLPPGEYLANALLSDEQRRRQQVFRGLLDPADRIAYPNTPTLFFWSEPLELGLQFPREMRQSHSAVVGVPLLIEQSLPGTQFVVPSSFIRVESVLGRQGRSRRLQAAHRRVVGEGNDGHQLSTAFCTATAGFAVPTANGDAHRQAERALPRLRSHGDVRGTTGDSTKLDQSYRRL